MRVAICYSGQGDRLKNYIHFVEDQLVKIHCEQLDIFIGMWDELPEDEIREIITSAVSRVNMPNINVIKVQTTHRKQNNIIKRDGHWSQFTTPTILYSMYTGIFNADNLRQDHENSNNFKYDLVIRSRPDIKFEGDINLTEISDILNNEALVVFPKTYNWFNDWHDNGGMLNDQFFISTSDRMSLITDIDINKCCDEGCRFHPESILWWHIVNQIELPENLKSKEIPWYKFMMFETWLRGTGKEVTTRNRGFEQENVEKFKLDKILPALGISF